MKRGAYRVLVGKPETKRPLGRLRLRWEGNVFSRSGGWEIWIELI